MKMDSSQKQAQGYKMQKFIYQLPSGELLFFDQENETYRDRFVMVADVTEEEMLFGEIIHDPSPRMTLETQAFRIYQSTDLEYNRKRAKQKIDILRREWLKRKKVKFEFDGVEFDGNDSEITVSAKENIACVFDALSKMPIEAGDMLFPMQWRTFDNSNFEFQDKQQFTQFFLAFTQFRLQFEKEVNHLTFQIKDQIENAETLEEIFLAENSFILPQYK